MENTATKQKRQCAEDKTKFQITISKDLKTRLKKLARSKELPLTRLICTTLADLANREDRKTA